MNDEAAKSHIRALCESFERINEDALDSGLHVCICCDAMPWEGGDSGEFKHEEDCALVAARAVLAVRP